MSESHWGGESLKWGVLAVVGAVVFMAGMVGLWFWAPWEEPTEAEWLTTYEVWADEIDGALAAGGAPTRRTCYVSWDDQVGGPPTERLEPVAAAAQSGCETLTPPGWQAAEAKVVRALLAVHGAEAPPRARPDFAEIAASRVDIEPQVYCWSPLAWPQLAEQYGVVRGGEEISLKGIADVQRKRIDLDPGVCAALGRYKRKIRPIAISYQNFEMAEALAVLTHQAEHLKSPATPEPVIECYAVQHVRPLIAAAGWGREYQTELALQAWELGYTQLPPYFRTPDCRDGGPLDRNPQSSAWP